MTQQEDWRERSRAALAGPVVDFDRYNPVGFGTEDWADVYAPGAVDLVLAGAVAAHIQASTGCAVRGNGLVTLQHAIQSWLRNRATGAAIDDGDHALMTALRAQLPRADYVCPICQEAHEALEDCGA